MTRPLSIYLDLVRFLAAAAVFVSHASWDRWTAGLLWPLRPLGSDAVAVFFVLSGFVVAYAATERERSGRAYAINRLARLHSGAVPAILLTLAADRLGLLLDPALYAGFADFRTDDTLWQMANALLFTHELWWNDVQPGTNVPYWSVGYEALYYLGFGLLLFAPRFWRVLGALGAMVLAGPDTAKLAPMWLLGAGAWWMGGRAPIPPRSGAAIWAASLLWLLGVVLPARMHATLFVPMTGDPMYWRDILHYYGVASAATLNLVGFRAAAPLFAAGLERAARPIRWLGGRTFSLYLFHMPLIQLAVAASPWGPASWKTRALVFLAVPAAIGLLAELSERRKESWRRLYDRLLPGRAGLEPPAQAR